MGRTTLLGRAAKVGVASLVLVAVAVELRGTEASASAALLGVALLLCGAWVGLRWVAPLPVVAWLVANMYVVHHGRFGWEGSVDPALLSLAVLLAAVGAGTRELHLVGRTVVAVRAWARRVRGRLDPDRSPSPRPFNHDEQLWELELTRR
jgi:hypothetical protein